MSEPLQVFGVTDRRALERNVFRSILEDEDFRRTSVLERLQQEDFETIEFRELYGEIQISALTGKEFDRTSTAYIEVISEGINLNGSWSAGVERLKIHRFDRLGYPNSDLGNAERFAEAQGSAVRYDHTRGQWLLWDGHRWKCDEVGEVVELMGSTLRGIYADVKNLLTESERKATAKWALVSESRAKIYDALTIAQNLPKIRSRSIDFDRNPYLVNCPNGTLDLGVSHFRPHNHTDLITRTVGAIYNESAKCEWWEVFLNEIFNGDQELIGFIQRSAGYSLGGLTDAQFLWFLHGNGANGKSTFVKILSMILGSYHQNAPSNMLLMKKGEGANNDIARLCGARFVTCQEIESGRRMAESQVKSLTGGDRVVARFLYGEYFEFEPTHKLWLIANHKPVILGTDDAIWRRVLLIPFLQQIPQARRKPLGSLVNSAHKEASGILNWLIEGWIMYKAQGLGIPDNVRAATQGYRDESDTIGQFLNDSCLRTGEVPSKDLFNAYQAWSGSGGMSLRGFQEAMKEKGFEFRVGHYKKRFWQGISLSIECVERVEPVL